MRKIIFITSILLLMMMVIPLTSHAEETMIVVQNNGYFLEFVSESGFFVYGGVPGVGLGYRFPKTEGTVGFMGTVGLIDGDPAIQMMVMNPFLFDLEARAGLELDMENADVKIVFGVAKGF